MRAPHQARRTHADSRSAGQLETRDLSEIAEDLKDMVKRQTGPSSPVVLSAPSSFTCIGPTLFVGETCTAQTAICWYVDIDIDVSLVSSRERDLKLTR